METVDWTSSALTLDCIVSGVLGRAPRPNRDLASDPRRSKTAQIVEGKDRMPAKLVVRHRQQQRLAKVAPERHSKGKSDIKHKVKSTSSDIAGKGKSKKGNSTYGNFGKVSTTRRARPRARTTAKANARNEHGRSENADIHVRYPLTGSFSVRHIRRHVRYLICHDAKSAWLGMLIYRRGSTLRRSQNEIASF